MTATVYTDAPTAGRAAAEWWAEQLGAPVFKVVSGKEDDRQSRDYGDTVSLLGSLLADRYPIREGQGKKFVEVLSVWIDYKLATNDWGVSLDVDYGPDLELAKAADAAGIHVSRFPYKTHMWVKRDHVTAALGYGAQSRLIWSAPDWVRPPCGTHVYTADGCVVEANQICTRPIYHDDEHGDWLPDPARCADCGGSYVDHYGKDREYLGHSYEPVQS